MAGITHNVTLQAAQDALADALCELVEARDEVERLRGRAERAEDELSEVIEWAADYLNDIVSLITRSSDTPWTAAKVRAAAGLDAEPGDDGPNRDGEPESLALTMTNAAKAQRAADSRGAKPKEWKP